MMTTSTDIGQDRPNPGAPPLTEPQQQEQGRRIAIRGDDWAGEHFINVGSTERNWSTYGGAALLALGLARGRLGGLTLAALGGSLLYRGVTGHCPLYSQLGRSTVDPERDAPDPEEFFKRGIHVEKSVTILKPREELFRYWRQFDNLPRIMRHLESVNVIDDRRSHWVAQGPAGTKVEWDAEIINEVPNELIAWRSLGGAEVDNAGSVRFLDAPGDRGTELHVTMEYIPPAGRLGSIIAKMFGRDADQEIKEDLRNFKRMMEVGELPTTVGQPRGTCTGKGERQAKL
jgi:uncharacterized membrane protein